MKRYLKDHNGTKVGELALDNYGIGIGTSLLVMKELKGLEYSVSATYHDSAKDWKDFILSLC